MLKGVVKEDFAVINTDDFYGRQAFNAIAEKLKLTKKDSYNFCMVAYALKNTVSNNGYVSLGECTVNTKVSL